MTNQKKFYIFFTVFLFYGLSAFTQINAEQIDSIVEKSMDTFNVPGVAVAVIKDGETIVKKGYGVRSIKTKEPVNNQTLFGIASHTKAFTSAALAKLVDEEKIEWDTKVSAIIPEFKLYDSYTTAEFTIRDLLAHRGGLGLGAGDLMVFPASNNTTLKEMIHNLRYLKPTTSFRSAYNYNNLMYVVAGEIVSRVSEVEYEDYIAENFLEPLGMNRATMDFEAFKNDDNKIDGHAPVDGKLKITKRTFTDVGHPAAGIQASIDDMEKWVLARLNYGKYGDQLQDSLFSKQQAQEMWSPQVIIPSSGGDYDSHFTSYGLGWVLNDTEGYFEASHTGGLLGKVSKTTLIPELDLGIIVLTNQQSGAAFNAITNSIKDAYLGVSGKDRIGQYNEARLNEEKRADSIEKEVEKVLKNNFKKDIEQLSQDKITGTYKDSWFGEVVIEHKTDQELIFRSVKSSDLTGTMHFYKGNTYVVRWNDPSLKADAFVNFSLNTEGEADGFSITAISPLTDFSFDFDDLDFQRKR